VTFSADYKDYFNLRHRSSETKRILVAPLDVQFNSGDRVWYSWSPNLEQLFEPFEIREGLFIPTGKYWTGTHQISASTSGSRPLSASIDLKTGSFYSGTRRQMEGTFTWKRNSHLSTAIELEQNWVRLKEGHFNTRLLVYRLDYSFTPLISLTNLVQYDTDSQNIGIQSRLRWILKPGNELYFVINHAWREDDFNRFVAAQTHARVKLNYTFRF
jgi:hypothetical protein